MSVRNQRSRWGSCSVNGTISLNWRLVQTPEFVRDYIIYHELMHLREMNHSARFWARVEEVCPPWREAEHWLKRVGLGGFGDRYPHQLSGGMRKRTSLAQTLVLDPDIILMDEPFSALDIQTRQLMENEVLELWQSGARRAAPSPTNAPSGGQREAQGGNGRKAVLFITHDLDEAIAMSDRVIVLSAGPASHPIGEFHIDIERPRNVAEVKTTPRFLELHAAIWAVLRDEVLKGYQQQLQKAA